MSWAVMENVCGRGIRIHRLGILQSDRLFFNLFSVFLLHSSSHDSIFFFF